MDFRGDDPQYMHDEFISSSNPGGYQISCAVVPNPEHCYFHQAHLKGLAGPCCLGDACPSTHAKEKVSHEEFARLGLKALGPPKWTSSLEFHNVCKEFALKGECPNGMSQYVSCQDGNQLTFEELELMN